ncbi:hypothetical protein AB0910_23345 [Streptomyces sp. NPDC047002]|uniref:hypothetical protein n=1 Tax=Streptomyces sp. NPDC047002 TaxID=3155475 RepID=UPI003456BDEF
MSVLWSEIATAAAVHSGTGTQNNYYSVHPPGDQAPLSEDSTGRAPRELAKEHLLWLMPRFEPPTGYARAYARLVRHHVVLLDGEPGTGRTATAEVLLRNHAPRRDTFHEIVADPEQQLLDPEQIAEDGRLLLDLSSAPRGRLQEVEKQLGSFTTTLERRHAALVVILPTGSARNLPSFLGRKAALIERPPHAEIRILRRFLRLSHVRGRETAPPPQSLKRFVDANHSLEEAARFAWQVSTAVSEGTPFSAACDTVATMLADRSGEASALLARVRDSRTRGLLIATALLEGARSDAVHEAARALHTSVGGEAGASPVLAARPLSERFLSIDAGIQPDGCVRFAAPGMAKAVARQVWRDFPDLRNALRTWVAAALALPRLHEPEREALVLRFAELSLHEEHHEDLKDLALQWSRSSSGYERRAAVRLLGAGLGHRTAGQEFRAYLYDRSRQETLTRPERQVLVAVCRGDLAVHHPFAAVVRLHHLARREAPGTVAGDALMELAAEGRRLLRFLLGRVTHSSDGEPHRVPDAELFLRCADSPHVRGGSGAEGRPLAADPAVRAELATGWAEVFACLDTGRWFPCARGWFDTAARDGDAHGLVDVLIDACQGRSSAQGLLYRAAVRWAATRPAGDTAAFALPGAILQRVKEIHAHRAALPRETPTP